MYFRSLAESEVFLTDGANGALAELNSKTARIEHRIMAVHGRP
jgi:hypothetical protein